MGDGAFWLGVLNNDLLTARARGGRITLSPKLRVEERHRELVRKHRAALLSELAKRPDGESRPRDFRFDPPRHDEVGLEGEGRKRGQQPRVVKGRMRR